jgi:hypothetical protein
VTLLHATDLRQVPLILTYGLFSGIGRAPLAIGNERGRAYTREIVVRQGRKGGPGIVRAFQEWQGEGKLVWLPPAHLDRVATLRENQALAEGGFLPMAILTALEKVLRLPVES